MLLVGGDSLLVLDLGFDIVDGVRWLHIEGDGLASEGLHKDLHASMETKDKVNGELHLDVVAAEGVTILKLLTSKDEALLVGGDSLHVLDLGFDIVDGVRRLHVKGDGLASEGLHEDLHASTEMKDRVKG